MKKANKANFNKQQGEATMFDISIDKANADNPGDFRTFSIIEGGHG